MERKSFLILLPEVISKCKLLVILISCCRSKSIGKSQNYVNKESENSSNEDILNVGSRSLNVMSNCDSIDDLVFQNPSSIISNRALAVESSPAPQLEPKTKSQPLHEHNKKITNIKGLQRKLEQKVERAKKSLLHTEKFNECDSDSEHKKSSTLIAINRLPYPRSIENQRLVEYKSDNSDDEEVTFFPVHKRKLRRKHMKQKEDVDNFSMLQEMTIIESDSNDGDKSSDDDECDSQLNLELPPRTNESFFEKVRQAFCCALSSKDIF